MRGLFAVLGGSVARPLWTPLGLYPRLPDLPHTFWAPAARRPSRRAPYRGALSGFEV